MASNDYYRTHPDYQRRSVERARRYVVAHPNDPLRTTAKRLWNLRDKLANAEAKRDKLNRTIPELIREIARLAAQHAAEKRRRAAVRQPWRRKRAAA